ncbi:MAG TPA: hypothetical protein VGK56_12015 [Anaerolineales bacterium]
MSKKNRIKNLFERAAIEPADTQPRSTQQVPQVEQPEETNPPVESQEEVMEVSNSETKFAEEQPLASEDTMPEAIEPRSTEAEHEPAASELESAEQSRDMSGEPEQPAAETSMSADTEGSPEQDLLDDVRRSLIEEADKTDKESKWWHRFGRKSKKAEPEEAPAHVEIDLPTTQAQIEMVQDQKEDTESETYAEEIDDLINMLEAERQEAETEPAAVAAVTEAPPPPEPEPEIDFEQLKEQAFRPRSAAEAGESETDVRSIALEDGEEVFVEVQAQAPDLFQERVKSFENALKPYRRYMYLTLTFLGVVMAVIAALLIFNVYQRSRPVPVREAPNLPYPTSVSLPGGWTFALGRGAVQAGKWEPQGAEWLEGTEVCRWVSLPWSLQLEAVIRTLDQDDPIELAMSNNDKLVYNVNSVYQMTPEEIQQLDSNSPCLLIILTQSESEKRWVLTALP